MPKDIVNRIKAEIQFVPLSAEKGNLACYVNKEDTEGKEGIIVLTPFLFAPFKDKNGNEIMLCREEKPRILREIAHHVFGHHKAGDQKGIEENEKKHGTKLISGKGSGENS